MYTLRFALLLAGLFSLTACGLNQKAGVTGKVSGAANLQIVLDQFNFDGKSKAIGNAQADANGHFSILEPTGKFEKGLYRVQIGAKQIYFLLDGDEKNVQFTADLATLQDLNIKFEGSKAAQCYIDRIKEVNQLKGQQITPEMAKALIEKACNPLMGALMTSQFFGPNAAQFIPEFKLAIEKLNNDMPGSKYASDFAFQFQQFENSLKKQQAASSIAVGQPAPDINLPDPSGKNRALSSLKGKVVLLDFWASWCRPCRLENPHVVEIYKKYKDKGFTVYSVSLDRENGKDAWVQAIKQDGLIWENHVSDLKFWNSEAGALYGVNSIPQTFLLDREGKIAAINPRANLEEAIRKVLQL